MTSTVGEAQPTLGAAGRGAGPVLGWLRGYDRRWLRSDLVADLHLTHELDVETADVLAELRRALAAGGMELWLAGTRRQG